MYRRAGARHDRAAMANDIAGKFMRGAGGLDRSVSENPGSEIAGIEAVAGGGRIDWCHHIRHWHRIALIGAGDQRAVGSVLDNDLSYAEGLQPFDGRLGRRIAPQHRLVVIGR